jgi:hypothetical protein
LFGRIAKFVIGNLGNLGNRIRDIAGLCTSKHRCAEQNPMPKIPPADNDLRNWPIELLRTAGPSEAEQLSSLSWDSIKRNHADKIMHVSARRCGMRVGHALMLSTQHVMHKTSGAKAGSVA